MEKSLNLLFAPITEISVYLLEALLIETLGSIFAKSATDLLMVGTPSIWSLVNKVPEPTLIASDPAAAVTTNSSASDRLYVTETVPSSFKDKNNPSTLSV